MILEKGQWDSIQLGEGFMKAWFYSFFYYSSRMQVIFPMWRQRYESNFLTIWWANQAYSKKQHEKRISVTEDINFWRRQPETPFASKLSKYLSEIAFLDFDFTVGGTCALHIWHLIIK